MNQVDKPHLPEQFSIREFAVSGTPPSLEAIGPDALDNPPRKTVEEFANVSLAVVLAPSANDRIDVVD